MKLVVFNSGGDTLAAEVITTSMSICGVVIAHLCPGVAAVGPHVCFMMRPSPNRQRPFAVNLDTLAQNVLVHASG